MRKRNAAALARAGYKVTAFDISPHAVAWARDRFADVAGLEFVVADLFAPPEEWREAFDFVHETYTLQSLPVPLRARAFAPLARRKARRPGRCPWRSWKASAAPVWSAFPWNP